MNEQPKKRRGAPSKLEKLGRKVLDRLAAGESLNSICDRKGMPNKCTVFQWIARNPEFANQYAHAMEVRADADAHALESLGDRAEQLLAVCDPQKAGPLMQAIKMRADNAKWLLARRAAKKYGDKVDASVAVSLTITDTAKAAADEETP